MNHIMMAKSIIKDLFLNEKQLLPDVISIFPGKLIAKYANEQTKTFIFSNYGNKGFTIYVQWLDSDYKWLSNTPTNQMEEFALELNRGLGSRYNIIPNIEQITHTYSAYDRETRLYCMSVTMQLKQ